MQWASLLLCEILLLKYEKQTMSLWMNYRMMTKDRVKYITGRLLGAWLRSRIAAGLWSYRYKRWCRTKPGRVSVRKVTELHNIHQNSPCVVIGNGPSLGQVDLSLLKNIVTIGSNGIFLLTESTGFVPNYYTIEDRLVADDRQTAAAQYQGPVKIFPYDLHPILGGINDAVFVRFSRETFRIQPRISEDLGLASYWGGTVTYFNIQLALHLGCSPIILVGVDHNYTDKFKISKAGAVWTSQEDDVNHFDPRYFGKGYRWHDPQVDRMVKAYQRAERHTRNTGKRIINATVGGKLEVFERLCLEEALRLNRR